MASNVYSFLDFHCALVGPGIALDLGAGAAVSEEGITISPSAEVNTMTIGADGYGVHSLHADKSGTITVRLLRSSLMNKALSAAYAFQTASAATHGQNTITCAHSTLGDVVTCRQVAFMRAPELSYSKDAGFVEWQFAAVAIDRTLGAG